MEENHLLPLYSSTEVNDSESDSSISSDDEVIENVIRMLDDVMAMMDVTNELPDDKEEDDDGQQQAQIHIPTTSAVDATTNPIHSKTSYDNKDKSIEGASSRRRSWTIQEKLNAINAFKKCKNAKIFL